MAGVIELQFRGFQDGDLRVFSESERAAYNKLEIVPSKETVCVYIDTAFAGFFALETILREEKGQAKTLRIISVLIAGSLPKRLVGVVFKAMIIEAKRRATVMGAEALSLIVRKESGRTITFLTCEGFEDAGFHHSSTDEKIKIVFLHRFFAQPTPEWTAFFLPSKRARISEGPPPPRPHTQRPPVRRSQRKLSRKRRLPLDLAPRPPSVRRSPRKLSRECPPPLALAPRPPSVRRSPRKLSRERPPPLALALRPPRQDATARTSPPASAPSSPP